MSVSGRFGLPGFFLRLGLLAVLRGGFFALTRWGGGFRTVVRVVIQLIVAKAVIESAVEAAVAVGIAIALGVGIQDAEIMFRVLEEIFRGNPVARRKGIPCQHQIFFIDLLGRPPNASLRAIAIEIIVARLTFAGPAITASTGI